MGSLLLVILVLTLMPLAAGALLALVLREIHGRHPLPLVEPGYVNAWRRPEPKILTPEPAEEPGPTDAVAEPGETAAQPEPLSAEAAVHEDAPLPGETSVFGKTTNVPNNLPISDVLDSMIAEVSSTIPDDLESRIEESTQLKDGLPQEVQHIRDDLDLDDLEDLAAALPKSKIDFSQEGDADPEAAEPILPLAKELLGEHFNFDSLEQQAKQHAAAIILDIQEKTPGLVQVSSPFLTADSSLLADLAEPQTVFSTFSDDWIQIIEPTEEEEDAAHFCFTEESLPMFVRKKKA
jgi:hypothetical protein